MPGWRIHRRIGRLLGIQDEGLMKRVDRMLDFPRVGKLRLPHKALHNTDCVLRIWMELGDEAANYALLHLALDRSRLSRLIEELEK
ncbi:MAG: hypothetical protein QXH00_10980 [Candidatus Jordarchaeales archaeon]